MSISIVDAFIVIFLILGGVVGYKNGFIKEGIQLVGLIIISIVSFIFKDSLMVIMYENLPFFHFFGLIKGITAVNILFYQLLSFLVIFAALTFFLRVIIVITGFVEWLVKLTVFLKVPSKILGIVVGVLEFYIYIFIILYVLNMPIFNLKFIHDSNFGNKILNNTPILSSLITNTTNVYSDIWDIIKNEDNKSEQEINTEVLINLLDNNLISIDSAKKIVDSNKVSITDKNILEEYEKKLNNPEDDNIDNSDEYNNSDNSNNIDDSDDFNDLDNFDDSDDFGDEFGE